MIYVVSSTEMILEQIDATPESGIPVAVGSVLKQSGTFNNGSLNGTSVLYMQDIHGGDGQDQSQAGSSASMATATDNVTAFDENLAGTITQDQSFQGTYTVQSNGAVSLNQTGRHLFRDF